MDKNEFMNFIKLQIKFIIDSKRNNKEVIFLYSIKANFYRIIILISENYIN